MERKFIAICENYLAEKALSSQEKFDEFLVKRAAGAAKIEKTARKKGGYSMLTAFHFAGKKKPYADSKKWETKEGKEKHYKEMYAETLAKVKDLDKLTQKEFQTLSGVLEVYGEVYIRSTQGPRNAN